MRMLQIKLWTKYHEGRHRYKGRENKLCNVPQFEIKLDFFSLRRLQSPNLVIHSTDETCVPGIGPFISFLFGISPLALNNRRVSVAGIFFTNPVSGVPVRIRGLRSIARLFHGFLCVNKYLSWLRRFLQRQEMALYQP